MDNHYCFISKTFSLVPNNRAAHFINFSLFPCLHGLLGTARLLILLITFYLHLYLELKIHCFREKFVNFTWYMTTISPLTCLSNWLLLKITSIFDILMAHKWPKSSYFWTFSYLHAYWILEKFPTCTIIRNCTLI